MIVPENLRYSQDHEWVDLSGDTARIGITDYAQDALGDVVFVELPDVGAAVTAGATFGEVESTKSVSDLFAPMSGEIVEINGDLVESPERLNEDPYGEGWICAMKIEDMSQYDGLLDAAAYQSLIEG